MHLVRYQIQHRQLFDPLSPTLAPIGTPMPPLANELGWNVITSYSIHYTKLYELTAVEGVAEVASIGGFVRQYQVALNPNRMLAYNIPLSQIKQAIQKSNNDVGGRLLEMGETEFMIRGRGYLRNLSDLEKIRNNFV